MLKTIAALFLALTAAPVAAQDSASGHFYIDKTYKPLALSGLSRVASGESALYTKGPALAANAVTNWHLQWYQWPGTYFEGAFDGTEVVVKLDDKRNIVKLSVDSGAPAVLTKPGYVEYRFAGLKPGHHVVRFELVTEDQGDMAGVGAFYGFYVPGNETPLPPPTRARQIEFIGDSYTVGYGNTSGKRSCTRDEVWATTDTSQAFGPLTARHYGADYQVNAVSGRGIVRNYNGSRGKILPLAWPFVLPSDSDDPRQPQGVADHSRWQPQIIAIGLGTNDFSTPLRPGEPWTTRAQLHADYEAYYTAFVQSIRARNPNAFFILMAADQFQGEMPGEINTVITRLNALGEHRIAFLPMTGLNFGGCDGHPDLGDDRRISDELIGFIDQHPDIWHGQ